jgi:hypothetical protein
MKMIGFAKRQHGLYILDDAVPVVHDKHVLCNFESVNSDTWHLRLGHLPLDKHAALHKQYSCIDNPAKNIPCDICSMARMKRLSFPVSFHKSDSVFDLVHVDIWGPMPQISLHGDRYFLTLVDDYSRHTCGIMLKHKSEVRNHIKQFVS